MTLEITEKNATAFSKSFAQSLVQLISEFPQQYGGFFPRYMTSPFRSKAIVTSNAIAMRYVRPSSKLRLVASPTRGRLEGAIFPHMGTTSMFRVTRVHNSGISHMTLANKDFADSHQITGGTNLICPSDFGVAEVGDDVEFIFEDVGFAWRIGKRDVVLYEPLLWILSPPALDNLGSKSGAEKAVSRFED